MNRLVREEQEAQRKDEERRAHREKNGGDRKETQVERSPGERNGAKSCYGAHAGAREEAEGERDCTEELAGSRSEES